jgi:hypothetical protein
VLFETNTTAYQGERKFQGTGRIEGKQISWVILSTLIRASTWAEEMWVHVLPLEGILATSSL